MADTARWYEARITEVVDEGPLDRTFLLAVAPEHAAAFRFVPGQYVLVRDPDQAAADAPPRPRAYSLSTEPREDGRFGVTVRDTSGFADHLFARRGRGPLEVQAPEGGFVLDVRPGQHLVLLGGGSGTAPYRSFVRHLRARGHADRVVLVSSARAPDQLLFDREMREHERACPWFTYVPTVTRDAPGDGWTGRRGRVDAGLLARLLPDPASTALYACGPTVFVDAVMALAEAAGVPAAGRRRERWG